MSKVVELRPCPYCGGRVVPGETDWKAHCTKCGVKLIVYDSLSQGCIYARDMGEDDPDIKAIKADENKADVQEVKHGKWERFYLWDKEMVVCDCCNDFFPAEYSETWNYCPCCGAKMIGKE